MKNKIPPFECFVWLFFIVCYVVVTFYCVETAGHRWSPLARHIQYTTCSCCVYISRLLSKCSLRFISTMLRTGAILPANVDNENRWEHGGGRRVRQFARIFHCLYLYVVCKVWVFLFHFDATATARVALAAQHSTTTTDNNNSQPDNIFKLDYVEWHKQVK